MIYDLYDKNLIPNFLYGIDNIMRYSCKTYQEISIYSWINNTFFLQAKDKFLIQNFDSLYKLLKEGEFDVWTACNHQDYRNQKYSMVFTKVFKLDFILKTLNEIYEILCPGGKIGIIYSGNEDITIEKIYKNLDFEHYDLLCKSINDARKKFDRTYNQIAIALYKKFSVDDNVTAEIIDVRDCERGKKTSIIPWKSNSFLADIYQNEELVRNIYLPDVLFEKNFTIDDLSDIYQINKSNARDLFNEFYSMNLLKIYKNKEHKSDK